MDYKVDFATQTERDLLSITQFLAERNPAAAQREVDSRLETFEDWKKPNEEGVVYHLSNGRVRGVLLWNVWEKVEAARALIAEPGPFDSSSLKGRLSP